MSIKTITGAITMLASGARSSNGNTSGFDVRDTNKVDIFVRITAKSGTNPTLDVTFQTTDDIDQSSADWFDLSDFDMAQITVVGNYRKTINAELCRFLRAGYAIGGTSPSFTFSIKMVKHQEF